MRANKPCTRLRMLCPNWSVDAMSDRKDQDPEFRGTDRRGRVPSCAVDLDALRRIYHVLQSKNEELVSGIIAGIHPEPGQTPDDVDKNVRSNLRVTVAAIGSNGEQ